MKPISAPAHEAKESAKTERAEHRLGQELSIKSGARLSKQGRKILASRRTAGGHR